MNSLPCLKLIGRKNVLYVAEVRKVFVYTRFPNVHYKCVPLYKYGISGNVYNRINYNHRKFFDYFDIMTVRQVEAHREVENALTRELKHHRLHLKMDVNGRMQKELFYLDENEYCEKWFQALLDELIQKHS